MAKNQGPRRSDEEWFRLINECRRSGLSDSLWCKQQGIPASSFFCAVRRLREKAYALPVKTGLKYFCVILVLLGLISMFWNR